MKITKYLHSCLLVEEQDKIILLDPGKYTFDANVFPLDQLTKLDYLLITHEHADHFYLPFVRKILEKFSDCEIISTDSIVKQLETEQITATSEGDEFIQMSLVPHEDVVVAVPPENFMFTINGKLSHPGDSHHFSTNAPILALPIQAPWGSFTDALKLAESISPKYVLPIHDWHWKDDVRKSLYQQAAEYLQQSDIEFKSLETGEIIEIN